MSDEATRLRRAVAEFFAVGEGEVVAAFPLTGRGGPSSITRAALDAALRRAVGARVPAVDTARTFGELLAGFAPGSAADPPAGPAAPTAAAPAPAAPTAGAANGVAAAAPPVACGVDMELVANLPAADDYWDHAFYRATFAPAEIAYCLAQPDPPPHFCARWCAKEALRKCDPAFLAVGLSALEVAHDGSGAPHFRAHADGSARRLPHALSLSHTATAAVAVVVRAAEPPRAPRPAPAPAPAPAKAPAAAAGPARGGRWAVLLALAALGLAAAALYRTWP